MIVVIDDADREGEGDLVVAAELVTGAQMAFLVRHTTGLVCVPMSADRADALQLPVMVVRLPGNGSSWRASSISRHATVIGTWSSQSGVRTVRRGPRSAPRVQSWPIADGTS